MSTQTITARETTGMTRQLATLLHAGIPLLQALQLLGTHQNSDRLRGILARVQRDIAHGSPLSAALQRFPAVFNPLYCNMVQAGEAAGILDAVLARLADTLEKNEQLRGQLRSALLYPTIVLVVAALVVLLILTQVVPVFEDVFRAFGAQLPWPTRMLMQLSQGLRLWGAGLIALVLVLVLVSRHARWRLPVKRWGQAQLLRLPFVGALVQQSVLVRWCQTLAALLASGIPMAEALEPVAQACGHPVYTQLTQQMRKRVEQGSPLSECLERTRQFPALMVQMCVTGEETGRLDELLGRTGSLMASELDQQISGLSTLIEPILIIGLGLLIGGILVAMYLPIFQMGQIF